MYALLDPIVDHWMLLVASAVVYFALGMLWYAPFLFGNMWAKYAKPTKADQQGMMGTMLLQAVATLVTSGAILCLWYGMSGTAVTKTVSILLLCLAFTGMKEFGNFLFQKKPCQIVAMEIAYHLVAIVLLGWVLSMWG